MSDQPTNNTNSKKGTILDTEILAVLLPFVDKIAEKISEYYDKKYKRENQYVEAVSKHDRRIIYVLLAFLGSVIIGMSVLTYFGKVSGEALLFAVGGIVGYVFAIIQRFIFGSQRSVTENSDSE